MFYKIVNKNTKEVSVDLGTNTEFYESIGMIDGEVEQAYNGNWYLKGYAPQQPLEQAKEEKIKLLKYNCSKYIYAKYPSFKQLNIANGLTTDEEASNMKTFIQEAKMMCDEKESAINNCNTLEELEDISLIFNNQELKDEEDCE